jgi:hypothetical protein
VKNERTKKHPAFCRMLLVLAVESEGLFHDPYLQELQYQKESRKNGIVFFIPDNQSSNYVWLFLSGIKKQPAKMQAVFDLTRGVHQPNVEPFD